MCVGGMKGLRRKRELMDMDKSVVIGGKGCGEVEEGIAGETVMGKIK